MTHPDAGPPEHAPPGPAADGGRRAGAGPTIGRRDLLRGAAAGALAGGLPAPAFAQGSAPALPAAGTPFSASTVPDLARALARQPYAAQRTDDLPEALRNLGRDQYAAIRTAPGAAIWGGDGLDFAVEPLHRGSVYADRVALYLVEDGTLRPVPYARDRFEAPPGLVLPEPGGPDPGFSGIRVRARFGGGLSDFAVFQGVSFFRLIARGQGFGVNARALMLRPADSRGEDFPRWRAFFVERPARGKERPGAPLVLHALIDAESCAAAYRMTLSPGDASVVEVEATLFTRAAIDHLGLGGAQTTFLFGGIDRRGLDDARAAAHASDGLSIVNGGGEAIWRPVHNPQTLQISSFLDTGPKSFGLMQRARDYAAFEDDVQHWEWRPSLKVEPLGASGAEGLWGPGAVTLLEIPSDNEVNENVIAYWRPGTPIPAGAEASFRYRQTWCWQPPEAGEAMRLARVAESRSGRGSGQGRRLFLVDFVGDILFSGPDGTAPELRVALSASPGTITRQVPFPYPERRTVRVAFELDPGGQGACELRLALKAGERQVTETWLYRWTA